MDDILAYIFISLGVVIAIVWPILKAKVQGAFALDAGNALPAWVRRYAILAAFALMTGLLLFAWWRSQHPTEKIMWYTALLLGFAWESTMEKLTTTPASPPKVP